MTDSRHNDTIVAIATSAGAGGVGIVRLSGARAAAIGETICGRQLDVRHAHHVGFFDGAGDTLDDGIAIHFAAPASFTGEDVVELQAHGSPVVLQKLVARCCELGARHARPGEFSERAFVNGKLDLTQAEAIADLIAAADTRAARAARRSLDGVFSRRVNAIAAELLSLRVQIEASIDFADEPIDTLVGHALKHRLAAAHAALVQLLHEAQRGQKLRDGLHAVIVGPPNVGKSSLLNVLAGSDRAIVTDIAGTTRDLLREAIRIDGVELLLVDTAGVREGGDAIEREGMRRARDELKRADLAIVVLDARDPRGGMTDIADAIAEVPQRLFVHNKADLLGAPTASNTADTLWVSARTGAGLDTLHQSLRALAIGDQTDAGDGAFTARARHVDGLHRAHHHLGIAQAQLAQEALELSAEELRLSHDALGEITGRIAPNDLLGHIFATFCIGK
ncbi:MAG: tRNA uridine-5-carboxymethylaminomethyl(34) synthesis GTPase MnmE [Lysobacter sp.]|nr:tRNA uridine-5-carboxymethylaminomethyl(34) synthesis GTPase MnmE [Lysobacter sp.]